MTEPNPQNTEAREAESLGEKPDRGRTPDALVEALSGTGSGSGTRAGSLRGGSATGSDDDRDQRSIDKSMAEEGKRATPSGPA